jgi:galactokinase
MMQFTTPYRVCPLGAHVDHQLGLVTGFALDKGVTMNFEPDETGAVSILSKNYMGEVKTSVHAVPDKEMDWGDYARASIAALLHDKYPLSVGFKGVIEGTLPVGGVSSSAAVIITYLRALCVLNHITLSKSRLVALSHWAESVYIGLNNGILDQSCEVYSKKDCLLYMDTHSTSYHLIPQNKNMVPYELAIIFSGVEHALINSAYNARVDECKATAYALKAYAGVPYDRMADTVLHDVNENVFTVYKDKLPLTWQKRAEHYYSEIIRVQEGVSAWMQGDLKRFGELVFESGDSSIDNYEAGSPELKKLHEIAHHADGVFGGRFSGAGFKGCYMAIIDPKFEESIIKTFSDEYLKAFPDMKGSFNVHFCHSANGVSLP